MWLQVAGRKGQFDSKPKTDQVNHVNQVSQVKSVISS